MDNQIKTPLFDDYFAGLKRADAARASTSAIFGTETPEVAAESVELGRDLGIPPQAVQADIPNARNQSAQLKSTTALIDAPKTQYWLADPVNGAIAKDDLENLTWFEKQGRNIAESYVHAGDVGQSTQFGKGFDTGVTGIKQMAIGTAAIVPMSNRNRSLENLQFFEAVTDLDPSMERHEVASTLGVPANSTAASMAHGFLVASPEQRTRMIDGMTSRLLSSDAVLENFQEKIAEYSAHMETTQGKTVNFTDIDDVKSFGDWISFNTGQSIPFLAAIFASGLVGGGAGVGAAGYAMGVGDINSALIEEGVMDRPDIALIGGVPYAALERLGPAAAPFRGIKEGVIKEVARGYFRKLGRAIPENMVEEFINEAGQEIVKDFSVAEGTGDAVELTDEKLLAWFNAGMAGAGSAPAFTAITTTADAPIKKFEKQADRSDRAGGTALRLSEVDEKVAASKLKARSPEKFKEAVGAIGNDDDAIFIPAAELREYFQSKDMEIDDETLEAWGIDPSIFESMAETGGDVSIPIANYATSISGSDDAAWFHDNAISDPEEFSVAEARRFNETASEVMQEVMDRVEAERLSDQEMNDSDVKIYDNVFSQLRAAGRSPDVAKHEATIWASFWRTMGERYGADPLDLAKSMGVNIKGPMTPEVSRVRDSFDVMLNTLRSKGDKALKPSGAGILDFIRDKGGIRDRGGDVESLDVPSGIIAETAAQIIDRESQPSLGGGADFNGKGVALDDLGRALIEAGYFPDLMGGADIQADGTVVDEAAIALEAIAEAVAGRERYLIGEGPDQDLSELMAAISEASIDLGSMSNDEIYSILSGGGQQDGNTLNQLDIDAIEFDEADGFKTGAAANFQYSHNTNSATKNMGLPQEGDAFMRDLEPSGKYMMPHDDDMPTLEGGAVEYGTVSFESPLVIPHEQGSWKKTLSNAFGGLTGKELSKAILSSGFDGIITIDSSRSGKFAFETVDLTTFDEARALYQSAQSSTSSPAFKAWFGDSKVVDADGNPLVVYHGTDRDFEAFDSGSIGAAQGGKLFNGNGFYFTTNVDDAKKYGDRVEAVYLNISNPANIKDRDVLLDVMSDVVPEGQSDTVGNLVANYEAAKESIKIEQVVLEEVRPDFFDIQWKIDGEWFSRGPASPISSLELSDDPTGMKYALSLALPFDPARLSVSDFKPQDITDAAKSKGHDGIIGDPSLFTNGDEVVAFEPTQIKSVHNRGTFDKNDPRIMYQSAAEKPLAVAHNISAKGLEIADNLGGLAVPSLGVVRADIGPIDGFGEITLVGGPELADPRQSGVRTFNADVYSVRQPRALTPISNKEKEVIEKRLDAAAVELGSSYFILDKNDFERYGLSHIADQPEAILTFLREKGIAFKVPNKKFPKMPAALKKAISGEPYEVRQNEKMMAVIMDHFDGEAAALIEKFPEKFKEKTDTYYFNDDGTVSDNFLNTLVRNIQRSKEKPAPDASAARNRLRERVRKTKKLESEYLSWIEDQFSITEGELFFEDDKGRKKPYNMDSLVRFMKGKVRDAEGFSYGVASIRSNMAREFKSLSQVKDSRSDILTKEEFEAVKEEVGKNFDAMIERLKPYFNDRDDFSFYSTASEFISDFSKGQAGQWKGILAEEIPADVKAELQDFLKGLAVLPTEYFEIKMQRSVDLSEFDVALVPKSVSPETVKLLKAKGLLVRKYDGNTENGRSEAMAKLNPRQFFQADEEFAAYHETKTEANRLLDELSNGGSMKAAMKAQNDMVENRDALAQAIVEEDGGIELTNGSVNVAITKSQDVGGGWRITYFNENGFMSHTEHAEKMGAVQQALTEGYTTEAEGALRKAMKSRAFFQNASAPRGSIQLPSGGVEDGQTVINLFEGADLSTFLHESGHFFLEAFNALAESRNAPQAMRDDLDAINKFLGRESGDPFTVEQHETWARGFEAYLLEGKAPSLELASSFARFKSWLTRIYKTVANLNVKITPEVRGVMDRMIATDEEIAQAREEANMRPLFTDAGAAGMSDIDFATYQKLAVRSAQQGEERLLKKTMAKIRRETLAWYKEEKAAVTKEVSASINKMPVYRLTEMLTNQVFLGETDKEVPDIQIDRAMLIEQFNEGVIAEIGKKRIGGRRAAYAKDGMAPQDVAKMFGFDTAGDMIFAMQNAGKRKEVIAIEVERVMVERHGDPLNDGSIEEAANIAIHAPQQAELVASEARIIAKRMGRSTRDMKTKVYKQRARLMLGRMTTRQASKPAQFLAAERRAAKTAEQAFAKIARGGNNSELNLSVAMQAKEQQILNHFLYTEAVAFEKKLQRGREKMRAYEKKSVREKLEGGYIQQIDALLDRFDFRVRSNRQVEKSEDLKEYIDRMIEDGREGELSISPELMKESYRIHYMRLPVDQLLGLFDTIENIDHMGRFKQKLIDAKKARDLQEVVDGYVASVNANIKGRKPSRTKGKGDDARKNFRDYLNLVLNADTHLREADGFESMGAAWTALKRDVDAGMSRLTERRLEGAKRFDAIYNRYSANEQRDNGKKRHNDALGDLFSKWDLISIALNTGNETNYERLTNPKTKGGFTPQQVEAALSELDARDWQTVQMIWDELNSYWPEIAAKEKRISGIAPPKVEAKVMVAGAPSSVSGGYYPIKYDNRLSGRVGDIEMKDLAESLIGGRFGKAQTKNGHTKARDNSTSMPLLLDLSVAHAHQSQVLYDLEIGEAVANSWRVLHHPDVVAVYLDKGMKPDFEALEMWLQDVASGDQTAARGVERYLRHARSGFAISRLALNVSTALIQPSGLAQSMVVVGKGAMARGFTSYAKNTARWVREVKNVSPFMREREVTFQRDIFNIVGDLEGGPVTGRWAKFHRNVIVPASFVMMQKVQFYVVDMPTWVGAYEDKLREGQNETEARVYADLMVKRAQGSGLISDRGMMERGTTDMGSRQRELPKLFTTLASYMFAKGNVAYERTSKANFKNPLEVVSWAMDMTLLFTLEAALYAVVKGYMPDEDENDEMWLLKQTAFSAMSTLPVLREIGGAIQGFGGGGIFQAIVEKGFTKTVDQASQGEFDKALVKAVLDMGGIWLHLPSSQTNTVINALFENDMEFKDDPSFIEAVGVGTGQRSAIEWYMDKD